MGRSPARCAARRFRRDPRLRQRSHSSAVRRSCQTIALWTGAAGRALPQHRRLALVGDADRGDRPVRGGGRFTAGRDDAPPDLLRVVLDPAGLRIMLGQFDLRGAAAPVPPRRTGLRGCWWCPGRSPECRGTRSPSTIPNSFAPPIRASLSPQRLLSSTLRGARQAKAGDGMSGRANRSRQGHHRRAARYCHQGARGGA